MGGLLHLVQRGGSGRAATPSIPLLAVPNVTAHPSTASVPTSYYLMWHYNCLWTLKGWQEIIIPSTYTFQTLLKCYLKLENMS